MCQQGCAVDHAIDTVFFEDFVQCRTIANVDAKTRQIGMAVFIRNDVHTNATMAAIQDFPFQYTTEKSRATCN